MISGLPIRNAKSAEGFDRKSMIPVSWKGQDLLVEAEYDVSFGQLPDRIVSLLKELVQDGAIEVQLFCRFIAAPSAHALSKSPSKALPATATLCVNLYGPLRLFNDVGNFTQRCGVYLQDPQHCDRNVRYFNPHRLSSEDEEVVMTLTNDKQEMETFHNPLDILKDLECDEDLAESEVPVALKTPLYRSIQTR